MYARVARFEGGAADAIRQSAQDIRSRAESGPPESVPAKGFLMLIAPDKGRGMGITFFETEDDLLTGDETLNSMSLGEGMGRRASVETYELAVDVRL